MKKAIVIFDTMYGNTEKIAKAVAKGLKKQGLKVDAAKANEVDISKLTGYDLIAVGGPTRQFKMSAAMSEFLKKLHGVELKDKLGFAFDTKVKLFFSGSAAKGIERELRKLGLRIAMPYAEAIVTGREGPLKEGEEDRFERVGSELAKYLAAK